MLDNEMLEFILDPLNWDKKSYVFNRDEKDMHPYSVHATKDMYTIVHNVLGVDRKDLKMLVKYEAGKYFLLVEGKTKDALTGKMYSVSSTFELDPTQLDINKTTSRMNNGLLYVMIPKKEEIKQNKTINIEIL